MKVFRLFLFGFLLLSFQNSNAQINLGLKVGANYNFNGVLPSAVDFKIDNAVSFSGGGLIRIKIKKISLQAEGLFISRKGIISANGNSKEIDFNAFDLPLMIGYKFIDLKVFKMRLNAGVIPSYQLGSVGDLEEANFKDSFYSATAGISIDIPLFIIDFRYQGAIGDYYELQNANTTTTLTNNLLTLSVAWKIL